MSVKKIKKWEKKKLALGQLERYGDILTLEYIKLMISELKNEKKIRRKALKLSRRRRTDYIT